MHTIWDTIYVLLSLPSFLILLILFITLIILLIFVNKENIFFKTELNITLKCRGGNRIGIFQNVTLALYYKRIVKTSFVITKDKTYLYSFDLYC